MNNEQIREGLREMMTRYNESRARWIAERGTDAGFDDWFTAQVLGR